MSAIFAVAALLGCEAKFAEKLVAPALVAQPEIRRGSGAPDLQLGPYSVEILDRDSGDARRSDATPGPALRGELSLRVQRGSRSVEVHCNSLREIPSDADLAALAGEAWDRVHLSCEASTAQGSFILRVEGELSENLRGTIEGPGASVVAELEVLLWYKAFRVARREAPSPIAQVYVQEKAVAASVLARPERTWFDADLDEAQRHLYLSLMLGLRFLPEGVAR